MPTQIQRSTQTQQALLSAAEALIAENGYAALSEARICERAKLTRGALRHHYPNGRYDLLPMLIEQLIERQSNELAAAGPRDPRERIYLMLYGVLHDPVQSNAVVILEVWMAARGDTKLAERTNPILLTALDRLFGVRADQDISPDVLALRFMLHGACMHRFSLDYERNTLVSAVQWLLDQLPPPSEFTSRFQIA
ncbi:TetR/AcrR family transcriptional regulator [Andreprevotia chitinilytica]|uniref:TetR/AcrR family transcriptional regulator n=1 Tax=Andreprevotia chitinilytica TaxID=396808 RepID=UPI00054D6953|nr:TetR/AcrR family transcriptional regulator [Andreprevotia chitinilytica]